VIQLDVCIETVFTESSAIERISQIARCGYDCVEFWLHDATFRDGSLDTALPKDASELRQACDAAGVTINNMVVNPPDDGSVGGSPTISGSRSRYLERVEEVIAFASKAGCKKAITCSGDMQPGLTRAQMRGNLEAALGEAAAIAARNEFQLLLEPLNSHIDHKGYYLDSSDEGAEIVRSIDNPALRLLYDVYHMQIMEGNIIEHIQRHRDIIAHFHSAGVPGRGEHDAGELNYPVILRAISETGYSGAFGLEYFPKNHDHAESLMLLRRHLQEG